MPTRDNVATGNSGWNRQQKPVGNKPLPTLQLLQSPKSAMEWVHMSRYRRDNTLGATWFFTVVTYRRQPVLCDDAVRTALRDAIITTRAQWPFLINAWVLLPDHLHCIWTLPEGDADFSTRWNLIKRRTSKSLKETYMRPEWMSKSKSSHRELTFWQRRFWEHRIRDDVDFERHADYIHYNPVKHGHVMSPLGWKHSTFHRFVQDGVYAADWGSNDEMSFIDSIGSE